MDMSKYKEMFLSEAREHLKKMGQLIVAQEKNPADRAGIDSLFREAHSIKGMAASMGYDNTAKLAHNLEDFMDGFRKSGSVPPEAVDRLLAGVDLLEGLLEDVDGGKPERDVAPFLSGKAVPPPSSSTKKPEGKPTLPAKGLQIAIELVEGTPVPAARALVLLKELKSIGTVLATKPTVASLRKGGDIRRLHVLLDTEMPQDVIKEALVRISDVKRVAFKESKPAEEPKAQEQEPEEKPAVRKEEVSRTVRVRTELLDRFIQLTGELITNRYQLLASSQAENWIDLRDGLDQLNRLISDLYHDVLQVRMMPLESITGRLPRLIRELCRKTGKDIALRLDGENVELDRAILEELADPLVHMVRNAADHGIDRAGEVCVSARREKDMVLVEIADNGRGMNPELLRKKAVEKGLLSAPQAKALRDSDALQLICYPGFSTAQTITETSGRGVGMDVVKSAVENLGGTLEISSVIGKGTRFLLKLPLSVAIIHILMVECDGHLIGIPVTRVIRTLEITPSEVQTSGRQKVIRVSDALDEEEVVEEEVALLSLRKILELPGRSFSGSIPVVLTEIKGRKVGMVVDRLAGHRQVFVQSLSFPIDHLVGVSGASVLGDGRVVFVIDPAAMLDDRHKAVTSR